MPHPLRPRRLARPRTPPFHGDNTGSNPVGDANKIKDLPEIPKTAAGPKRSNKDFHFPTGPFSDLKTSLATLLCALRLMSVTA